MVEAASGRATSRCARRAQISPGTRATVLVELNGIEPSVAAFGSLDGVELH